MRRLTLLLMALALVAAACSPGDDEGTESTTTTVSGGDETTTTSGGDDGEETTTTAAEVDETTTTQAPESQSESCVEGDWLLSTESFLATMEDIFSDAELGATEITPSEGTYMVSLDGDGTFTGVRDDWGFSVVTSDGTFHIRINGTEEGTWSADGSTMTVLITSSDVTTSSTVEFDGQTIQVPESPVDVPEALAESSSYTCNDNTLAVTTEGITIEMTRA